MVLLKLNYYLLSSRGFLKNKIIDLTIELSNDIGTHRVTTNHIIERLNISPGTFYYHFKNKEEIIRKIFDRITLEFDELLDADSLSVSLMDYALNIQRIYNKYRAFYCDLSMLIDRDDLFAKRYRENYRTKSKKLYNLTLSLEQRGVLKQFSSDEERYYFVKNQWIFNDCRLLFLKTSGENNSALEEIKSLFMFMKPYLSESSSEDLDKIIREKAPGEIEIVKINH